MQILLKSLDEKRAKSDDKRILLGKATVLMLMNDYKNALEICEKIMSSDPTDYDTIELAVIIHFHLKDLTEVKQLLQKLPSNDSHSRELFVRYMEVQILQSNNAPVSDIIDEYNRILSTVQKYESHASQYILTMIQEQVQTLSLSLDCEPTPTSDAVPPQRPESLHSNTALGTTAALVVIGAAVILSAPFLGGPAAVFGALFGSSVGASAAVAGTAAAGTAAASSASAVTIGVVTGVGVVAAAGTVVAYREMYEADTSLTSDVHIPLSPFTSNGISFHVNKAEVVKLITVRPPTHSECFTFAQLAYKNESELKTVTLPEGWTFVKAIQCPDTGYFGAAFTHTPSNSIVIAHRGTDPTNTGAILADIELGEGLHPKQYIAAKRLWKEFLDDKNKANVLHTGHSLGAFLAELFAAHDEYYCVTFDSPGIRNVLELRMKFTRDRIHDVFVTSYVSDPNIVNTLHGHVGLCLRLVPKPIKKGLGLKEYALSKLSVIMIQSTFRDIASCVVDMLNVNSHTMTSLAHNFEESCDNQGYPNNLSVVHKWPSISRLFLFHGYCKSMNVAYHNPLREQCIEGSNFDALNYSITPIDKTELPLDTFPSVIREEIIQYHDDVIHGKPPRGGDFFGYCCIEERDGKKFVKSKHGVDILKFRDYAIARHRHIREVSN